MVSLKIVNCAENIQDDNWNFLHDKMPDVSAEWSFFVNSPSNILEKVVTKPQLSRYRACLQAVIKAKYTKADLLISHLPRATCWTSIFANLINLNIPHLAFSFNFTDLPQGKTHQFMSYAFQKVDRFVVYSTAEKILYTDYFGLNPEKIDFLPFAMDLPEYESSGRIIEGDYICAVGSEGRDYATLAEAMKTLPNIPLVIVTRPYVIKGLNFSENVKIFTNLPIKQFWSIVKFSKFVVIPLRNANTNCGHISIVGSMRLDKAIITTASTGITDYIFPGVNSLVSPAQDVTALAMNIERLWRDSNLCSQMETEIRKIVQENHTLSSWTGYLKKFLENVSKDL
jgi:glycosyltransferase involved in cell wall biosynthesis